MKSSTLLAFATAALLTAGPALAGPNCRNKDKSAGDEVYEVVEREGKTEGKCNKGECDKNKSGEEGVYEVAEREGKGERAEKGERKGKDERKGDRPKRGGPSPLAGLGLSDDQKAQVKEIMTASREQAKAIMVSAKEAKDNGEEVDREAVREKLMALRKSTMDKVYNTVLNEDQKAKVDERRKKMEERRAEREKSGEGKERPKREGKGGEGKKRGGDLDL